MKPIAPLFSDIRELIYTKENELVALRKQNATDVEIDAKIREIDDIINGR